MKKTPTQSTNNEQVNNEKQNTSFTLWSSFNPTQPLTSKPSKPLAQSDYPTGDMHYDPVRKAYHFGNPLPTGKCDKEPTPEKEKEDEVIYRLGKK